LPGIKFAPKEASAFFNLKHTAERKDGVIPGKCHWFYEVTLQARSRTCQLGHGRSQAVVLKSPIPGWSSTPRGMAIEPTMKPL
jgi:hypothetical protein